MKKKSTGGDYALLLSEFKHINRIMKLILIFLVLCVFTVFSENVNSQTVRVHIEAEQLQMKEIIEQIEKQTDYLFVYNNAKVDLNRRVSFAAADVTVAEVLNRIFENTEIVYAMEGNNILLMKKSLLSQQKGKQIKGIVKDSHGDPVIGANVVEKGTTNGTITDIEGNFSLSVSENAVLQVSYLGYVTQEIPVKNERFLTVLFQEDLQALDEVVVVGYGAMKKSVITGAISSIPMNEVKPVATQRVDQMLQGQAAGVLVLNTDGSPGAETTIRIRGMNSIQGGNNALIVIDGFQGGELRSINPNDIASIEVLKDAAATAIYGAQGANGVILITTKRGTSEKPSINYSSEVGFSKILMGGVELMNAADYARELNAIEIANDLDRVPEPLFTEAQIKELEKSGGTDWMDEVYRPAFIQSHQLSVSGKTKKVNYFVSGSFLDQEGIMINSGYERYSLRSNVGATVTDWLNVSLNWDGAIQNRSGADFGGGIDWPGNPVLGAVVFSPTIPVYDENGNYSKASNRIGDPAVWNPVASAKETQNDRRTVHNNINLVLNFNFLKYFSLQINGGARITQSETDQFYNGKTFMGNQSNGIGRVRNNYSKDLQNSNVLNYTRDIGLHNLNVTAVGEIKVSDNTWSYINNSNFAMQETGIYDLNAAQIQKTSSGQGHRKILSGVGRINYGYDNKYLLSMSIRADGSSVFGENNKWGYFPAASIGWRLSRENFMKHFTWIDDLMIRASWGNTGNQAISNFQTISQIGSSGKYPWYGGDTSNLGYAVISASNPDLKWESTRQYNFGLNLSVWNGMLRFTGEYYDKVTSNLLMMRELPRSTGLSSIIDNVGKMGNKGWELSLNGNFKFGELEWSPGVNTTFSKTKVLDLGDEEFLSYAAGGSGHGTNIPFMFLTKGQPFGQIMGFGYEGTWKTGEENEAARYGQLPGDPKYTDVNKDGKIDYDNDWKVIGNTLPKMIFGITNRFEYKNFDLTFLLQGTCGNDIFNVARIKRDAGTGYGTAKFDRWTPEHQNTDVPALIPASYREAYRQNWDAAHPDNHLVSTITLPTSGENVNERWIEKGSYIRLKNLTLGYTFSNAGVFDHIRVYLTATNLFTITKYSGFDPEVSSFTGSDAQLGTDFNSYPSSRVISLGININL